MSNALDRLSKIVTKEDLLEWVTYHKLISDIQEVVALAKKNQQPSIDAMRFEAAKTVLPAIIEYNNKTRIYNNPPCGSDKVLANYNPETYKENKIVNEAVKYADALIAELQKTKQ